MPGKGTFKPTCKLREVIHELARIGLSWVKAHAYELGITKDSEKRDVHMHTPKGRRAWCWYGVGECFCVVVCEDED